MFELYYFFMYFNIICTLLACPITCDFVQCHSHTGFVLGGCTAAVQSHHAAIAELKRFVEFGHVPATLV